MSSARRSLLQLGKIGTVTIPDCEIYGMTLECSWREGRFGQHARSMFVRLVGQIVSQHHFAIFDLAGKQLVVLEQRLNLAERSLKRHIALELVLPELLQHIEP